MTCLMIGVTLVCCNVIFKLYACGYLLVDYEDVTVVCIDFFCMCRILYVHLLWMMLWMMEVQVIMNQVTRYVQCTYYKNTLVVVEIHKIYI